MEEKLFAEVISVLGPGNKCLGKGWRLNFNETELRDFLKGLSDDEQMALAKCLTFFRTHLQPVGVLIDRGDKKSFTLDEFIADRAWSSFSLSVIFSIVDGLTVGKYGPRKEFVAYLKEHFGEIKDPTDLDRLSEEHSKLCPPSINKRLEEFYSAHLTDEEKAEALRKYRNKDRSEGKLDIDDFPDILKDLYGRFRSGFAHHMRMSALWNDSHEFSFDEKTSVISVYSNLSPSEFLFLSWKAIFRYFGFTGAIDTKFTDAEKEELKKSGFSR